MERFHVTMSEESIQKMDAHIKLKKINSRSELIDKAVNFYIDYNTNKEPGEFLARELEAIVSGNIELVEKRLGNRFSKLIGEIAIQLAIQQQIFKGITTITETDIETFRKIAVDTLKNTQKILKYEDIV